MKRKIFTLFLALVASVGTMFAWDVECVQIGNLYYNLDSKNLKAEVTSKRNNLHGYSSSLTITSASIPSTVSYSGETYKVTTIGNHAFRNCSSLTSIRIPNSVTSIGVYAFGYCSGLTSVTIPNSVTGIGGGAFSGCSGLTSVTIGNSVTSIADWAFQNCTNLTSIKIPSSVTSIGRETFSGCSGLTSIEIPNSVTSIGYKAFSGCTSLPVIDNIRYADIYLVEAVDKTLSTYTIKEGTKFIGEEAFYYCSSLTSITIPNSVTEIGWYAFSGCSGLTSVTIPNSVTSIGEQAFENCDGLIGELVIPNSVTHIGSKAFAYCTGLTSLTIPENITAIGHNAFSLVNNIVYTGSVTSFDYGIMLSPSISPWGAKSINGFVDGYIVYRDATKTELLGCSSAVNGEVIIPNSVINIGNKAFNNCTGLTTVAIPNSVTSIGNYAFQLCESLTSVTIGNSVTSIGSYAFYGCSGLTSIEIPNSVNNIGSSAFQGCSGLTSVTIGNSVTSIESSAFEGCSNITIVVWNAKNGPSYNFGSQVTSFTFGNEVEIIPAELCKGMTNLTSVTIGNSVTSIGSSAFQGCSIGTINFTGSIENWCNKKWSPASISNNLKYKLKINGVLQENIVIPNSVTSIGEKAFWNCSSLTSVTIGNSVTSIESSAFEGCSNITIVVWNAKNGPSYNFGSQVTSFTFGEEVEVIPPSACSGMTNLTSITIPNSVNNIGSSAFQGCTGLTSVVWNAKNCSSSGNFGSQVTSFTFGEEVEVIPPSACSGMTNLTSITIPNSVNNIGNSAFQGCTGLTSVTIPNSVNNIGNSAFQGCTGLTSIEIPNSVTSIGNNAFQGCSGLTSVTIPNSVTSIGNNAFQGCSGLTSVTIPNSVTNIGNSAFQGCTGLTSIEIPNSVNNIGSSAFQGCSGLTSVTIPNSVNNIGNSAFQGCTGLTSVTVNSNSVIRNNLQNIFGSQVTQYIIGSDITSIPNTISKGYSNLTSIVVESGNSTYDSRNDCNAIIETATNSLISGCKNTVIPDNVTRIDNNAFYGCSGLTSIEIPNSVNNIGSSAFQGCSGLTSVTIPNSVTSIGEQAFRGCSGLISVTIPNSVNNIGSYAFSGCSGLTSVTLNSNAIVSKNYSTDSNLKTIFGGKVTEYIIGDDVTSIGDWAFYNCSSLTSVTIGNSVTSIGAAAFRGCSSLTSITIPNSVTSIGRHAFTNCSISTINFIGSVENWCNKKWSPASISNNYKLKINGVLQENFVIPNSVTSIGEGAFQNCSSLTSITIGNSVTSIGGNAFAYCSNLTSVTCLATTPPTCWSSFLGVNCSNIPLYVPIESVSLYQATNDWKEFNVIGVMFADEVETAVFSATPTDDYGVILEWQAVEKAVLYNIDIIQGNDTIRKLQFDSNGKLLNSPSNAPSRYPNIHHASTAILSGNGWRCEVNDLDPGTNHTYSITVKAENGSVLYTQSIGFTTKEETFIIKFVNWNGEELLVLPEVVKGTTPSYTGETPVRPNTAEYTYTFAGWDPAIVAVTGDATYTATFSSVVNVYTISVSASNGQVIGGGEYQYGATIDLTAIPNEGYVFDQWSDGVKDNPRTITVTGDAEYTALFTSTEGFENIYTSEPVQKVIIDQKVYILRGDKTYTLQGQEVK